MSRIAVPSGILDLVSHDTWREESARTSTSFDSIADLYRLEFADELDRKPFDRDLLERVGGQLSGRGPVFEVGAGPAHIGGFLVARGVEMIASDLSFGQLLEARALGLVEPLVLCDLVRLPVVPSSLRGIIAFYCLIYGPSTGLDAVFSDWHGALSSNGIVVASFHVGDGRIDVAEWQGRPVSMTVVLRDPDDIVTRLESAGFSVEECTTRAPYEDEHSTDRCYVVARKI